MTITSEMSELLKRFEVAVVEKTRNETDQFYDVARESEIIAEYKAAKAALIEALSLVVL